MTEAPVLTRVINIEDELPYVEPPKPLKTIFADSIQEWNAVYHDEGQYYRGQSNWAAAGNSAAVEQDLASIMRSSDPEARAAEKIQELSFRLSALREAVMDARKTMVREEQKRVKAEREARQAATAAAYEAGEQAGKQTTIEQLRTEIKAIEAPKGDSCAVPAKEPGMEKGEMSFSHDDIAVEATEDEHQAKTRPVTVKLRKGNMTNVEALTRTDAVKLCASLMAHLKATRPEVAK